MNLDLALVLLLLAAAVVMFVVNRPRMDAVALMMIVVLPLTGVITMNEALAGFSDPNIVLIAALFVIGEGLVRTGVARRLGDWLDAKAGSSETRLLVLLMLAVGGLGALMSSTAVVAIFIPVVLRISQEPRHGAEPADDAAERRGADQRHADPGGHRAQPRGQRRTDPAGRAGLRLFQLHPVRPAAAVLGIGYMLFRARAGCREPAAPRARPAAPACATGSSSTSLAEREQRVRISAGSPLVGKRLDELPLRDRGREPARHRARRRVSAGNDPPGRADGTAGRRRPAGRRVHRRATASRSCAQSLSSSCCRSASGNYFTDRSQEIGMVEVILPAESELIGQTVLQARMRSEYGLTVIGLRRGGKVVERRPAARKAEGRRHAAADRLLVRHSGLQSDMETGRAEHAGRVGRGAAGGQRAPQALAVLVLVVGLMVSGVVPNVQAALIGCLLMGLLGCVDLNSAYRSISWKSLVLIVGMLPFSLALQRTGGVDLAADALIALVGDAAPRLVLATLFVITAVLGLFISNTATAVLMAPVALAIAKDLGASPYPFAMIVALAASTAFMTPISSPVNTLVVGPGNTLRRFRQGGRAVQCRGCHRQRAAGSDFPSLLNGRR